MNPMDDEIAKGLAPLFEEARRDGKVFYCGYQGLIFTPDELQKEQEKGSFRWGVTNWKLITKESAIKELVSAVKDAQRELDAMKKRLGI